ncbi:hypothetical protein [Rhodococcus sp. UFZ-B548]|uniref:hypothetical protein n=1 Tax=Rhodococcus sp. UFZ-B548 TaxID=2742212 RepID=UPI0015F385C3|nr:hypothetical protein [Rhodococcus sp. UFZ-B548]
MRTPVRNWERYGVEIRHPPCQKTFRYRSVRQPPISGGEPLVETDLENTVLRHPSYHHRLRFFSFDIPHAAGALVGRYGGQQISHRPLVGVNVSTALTAVSVRA